MPAQLGEQLAVVRGALHHPRQLAHVGREEHLAGLGRRPLGIETQAPEEQAEALGRAHLPVVLGPEALRLLPAPEERGHERGQVHLRREGAEGLVEVARGGAQHLAVHVHLGQAVPMEEHEGVEQVEEDRAVAHARGFRCAKPSFIPCQNSTADSP